MPLARGLAGRRRCDSSLGVQIADDRRGVRRAANISLSQTGFRGPALPFRIAIAKEPRMEEKQGADIVDLGAEVIALRTVVRLLVGQTWGQHPDKLAEIREAALQSIELGLAQLDLGDDRYAFTNNVRDRLSVLLADMPQGFGQDG
jgi:hypothetical protein